MSTRTATGNALQGPQDTRRSKWTACEARSCLSAKQVQYLTTGCSWLPVSTQCHDLTNDQVICHNMPSM